MITFSNGHELTFANGSGALAFNGKGWFWEQPLRWLGLLDPKLFTVVAKTVTFKPKEGNLKLWSPWTCVRPVKHMGNKGAVNAIGLTNPGIEHWVKYDYPTAKKMGYKIAISVKPENWMEANLMAELLKGLDLAYIETNLSCPNVHGSVSQDIPDMLAALKTTGHPVVLKLSHDQVNNTNFVKTAEAFVEAFHAINTIPWAEIFPTQDSPIQKYKHGLKGGVSGDFIRPAALYDIQTLKGITTKPIIGGGGIMSVQHVKDFRTVGAQAFSIGTLFLRRPWAPSKIVKECRKMNIV